MAAKQDLREFQSRLAQRLQAAESAGVTVSWLAVEAVGLRLLFPLSHSGEIFSWGGVQPVPYASDWFWGVTNLRGGLVGVVDLGALIQKRASQRRTDAALAQCRLVAFNPVLETNCALLVDRVLGLRTTEAYKASSAPAGDAPGYFGHSYLDQNEQWWHEVNLQMLTQDATFLNIRALSAQ